MRVELVFPTMDYADSWQEAMNDLDAEGTKGFWKVPGVPLNVSEYVPYTKEAAEGKNLPKGWVPNSTFWLIVDGEFVGHGNIRHELNDWLSRIGGHIGYTIAPKHRRKGYGTKILELLLPEAARLGHEKVLMTCDEDNVGSRKIIERVGAEFEGGAEWEGKQIRRYWLQVSPGVV